VNVISPVRKAIAKGLMTLFESIRVALYFRARRGALSVSTLRRPPHFLSQYYDYCVQGILHSVEKGSRGKLAIFLFGQNFSFGKDVRRILINTEHTLVRQNGRNSSGSPIGQIPVIGEGVHERYLVRIPAGIRMLNDSYQVMDYSRPNLTNVSQSEFRDSYFLKAQYIAPLLSPRMLNRGTRGRDYSQAFTFMSLPKGGDRRSEIIDKLSRSGVGISNIQGLVGDVSETMSKIGILLNLHQTDHHHTLEELRILPALLQGVIVVSEPSPLVEEIPYSKFVTFASIEEMPGVLGRLLANYENHWAETFASGEFNKVVHELEETNNRGFATIVRNLGL
jgi:hypothetical protein